MFQPSSKVKPRGNGYFRFEDEHLSLEQVQCPEIKKPRYKFVLGEWKRYGNWKKEKR